MDKGVKDTQYVRALCNQMHLPDAKDTTKLFNDNRGSVDWVHSGCKATKKLRHENISEFRIAEARKEGDVDILWIPGQTNPADLFTKEINDDKHFITLRDLMVMPRPDQDYGGC